TDREKSPISLGRASRLAVPRQRAALVASDQTGPGHQSVVHGAWFGASVLPAHLKWQTGSLRHVLKPDSARSVTLKPVIVAIRTHWNSVDPRSNLPVRRGGLSIFRCGAQHRLVRRWLARVTMQPSKVRLQSRLPTGLMRPVG